MVEEGGFKNLLIGFLFVSLFGMLILSSVLIVGNDYGKNTTEVVGGSLAIDRFNQSITSIEQNSKDMQSRFESQSIWSAIAGVVVNGIFGIAKDMVTMILTPFAILSDIMANILGVPTYVTSVLLGILILTMMFAVWRLIKIGD
jgi:hypothetical protein